jgi:hypothetical protein
MTHDTEPHTPTPEFRAGLEAEVLRAFHREQRAAATRFWNRSRVRTLARVAAVLVIGMAVGAAPAQVQDARQRDSLITSALAEERLASLRYMLAREDYERAVKRVDVGLASRASLATAEADLRAAETQVRAIQLNIEEIRATSAPPRDDLAAPAISGRDFVKERLQLEAARAQRAFEAARAAAEESARRRELGLEAPVPELEAEVALATARSRLALLAGKLRLRERFVQTRTAAAEMERELRTLELEQDLMLAQRRAQLASARLRLVRDAIEKGTSSRADLLRAELETLEQMSEIEKIETQLRALRSRGGDEETAQPPGR